MGCIVVPRVSGLAQGKAAFDSAVGPDARWSSGREACPAGRDAKALNRLPHNNKNERIESMNKLELFGDWNIIRGKIKQKWATLTDDDLQFVEGKQDELIGRIQKRTGEAREVVERALRDS